MTNPLRGREESKRKGKAEIGTASEELNSTQVSWLTLSFVDRSRLGDTLRGLDHFGKRDISICPDQSGPKTVKVQYYIASGVCVTQVQNDWGDS